MPREHEEEGAVKRNGLNRVSLLSPLPIFPHIHEGENFVLEAGCRFKHTSLPSCVLEPARNAMDINRKMKD